MAMLTGVAMSRLAGMCYMSFTTMTSPVVPVAIVTIAIVTAACRLHLGRGQRAL